MTLNDIEDTISDDLQLTNVSAGDGAFINIKGCRRGCDDIEHWAVLWTDEKVFGKYIFHNDALRTQEITIA